MNPVLSRLAILLVAALTVTLAACGGDDDDGAGTGAQEGASDTLIIAIPGTPTGVDVDRLAGPQTWSMAAQIFGMGSEWSRTEYPYEPAGGFDPAAVEGFTYPDVLNESQDPGLIESCDLSEDGTKATYHLREGVKSFYGNEFTSADVLWRVERAAANESHGAFMISSVNAPALEQYRAVDDYTVEITSPTAMPLICKVNTNMYWTYFDSTEAKKHATDDDPWANEWLTTHDAAYGPYHITTWKAGEQVVMEANENYWEGPPAIKKIIYRVVPESANRVALLQSGEVDMAEGLSPEEIAALNERDGVHGVAIRSNLGLYAQLNNAAPPYDDVRVRQAIAYATPREDIAAEVYRGLAAPWEGVYPSVYPGYVEFNDYGLDLEKAKSLLAEAGVGDGFTTKLSYNAGDPVQENVAVLMQSSLREIGVDVELEKLPSAALEDLVASHKAEFALFLNFPIQPDPNYSLRLIYESSQFTNFDNYKNEEVDQMIADGVAIVDPEERYAFHEEPQKIIHDEVAVDWIVEPFYTIGLSDRVKGFGWDTVQNYRVYEMSLD